MSLQTRFRVGMIVLFDGEKMRVHTFSPGGNYVHLVPPGGGGYATALSESDARKRVVAPGEDPVIIKLTDRERLLYEQIKSGVVFVKGHDVRTARRLSKAGLVQLDDNGFMQRDPGSRRSDGERWYVKVIAR